MERRLFNCGLQKITTKGERASSGTRDQAMISRVYHDLSAAPGFGQQASGQPASRNVIRLMTSRKRLNG